MKLLLMISILTFPTVTFAYQSDSYRCDEYSRATSDEELRKKAECQCSSPAMGFLLDKLKESFGSGEGEKLLKEVVTEPQNYPLREELKNSYRRLKFARIREKPEILQKMQSDFEKIIDSSNLRNGFPDFPARGLRAEFTTSEQALVLKMQAASMEELDFLPPATLAKISPHVSIQYFYPIDHYEYLITFAGEELPMKKAFRRIQEEFEVACYNRFWENVSIRKSNEKERGKSGNSTSKQ